MKSKVIHICLFFTILLYIFFWAGVSIGKSAAGTFLGESAAEVAYDALGTVKDIQSTYNYESFEAEGRCSGCAACGGGNGECYAVVPGGFSDSYIEISGVGLFPVRSGKADRLQIYFNDCEAAEDFGCQSVYVRRCNDAL